MIAVSFQAENTETPYPGDLMKRAPTYCGPNPNGRVRQRDVLMSCTCMYSEYGMMDTVKKTLNIDEELFTAAKTACGALTDTETVRLGLEALVRRAAYDRLRSLQGSEPDAEDVPRRREDPAATAPTK
jgi:Arc/MetJ family transcription regulator